MDARPGPALVSWSGERRVSCLLVYGCRPSSWWGWRGYLCWVGEVFDKGAMCGNCGNAALGRMYK